VAVYCKDGGWVNQGMEGGLSEAYWLWQAQRTYEWYVREPDARWEQLMYFYLFKWSGYEGKI